MGEHMKVLYCKDRCSDAMKPKMYFSEFLQYFLSYQRDEQWETYINLCKPSKTNCYSVMRHENFQMDFPTVMKMYRKLKLTQANVFLLHRNGSDSKTFAYLAKELMPEILQHIQVYQLHKEDFDLFEH